LYQLAKVVTDVNFMQRLNEEAKSCGGLEERKKSVTEILDSNYLCCRALPDIEKSSQQSKGKSEKLLVDDDENTSDEYENVNDSRDLCVS